MTDHPASWLADPTGRHDHRYWDGAGWTDHVADAGVAATDPYDGPPDATPSDAAPPAADTTTSPSGWAGSGWASTTEPAETEQQPEPAADAGEPAAETPAATNPWTGATAASSWGAAPAGEKTETEDEGWGAAAAEVDAEVDTTAGAQPLGSYWGGSSTSVDEPDAAAADAPVADEATAVTDAPAARWGAGTTSVPSTTWDTPTSVGPSTTWGQPLTTEPTVPLSPPPEGGGGGSRTRLILVIALLAIVAVVVALVLTGDDDEGSGGGSSIANGFSEQLQDQTNVTEEQADCVGRYVVDEIGESRLQGVRDLDDRSVPPQLQEDLGRAVQRAFTECDVDQQDLQTGGAAGTDGGSAEVADDSAQAVGPGSGFTEAQYKDYYQQSLGISEEDAQCLAEKSAEAEESGAIEEGDGISQFYQWVDDCGIDPDELFQTIASADSGATTG